MALAGKAAPAGGPGQSLPDAVSSTASPLGGRLKTRGSRNRGADGVAGNGADRGQAATLSDLGWVSNPALVKTLISSVFKGTQKSCLHD